MELTTEMLANSPTSRLRLVCELNERVTLGVRNGDWFIAGTDGRNAMTDGFPTDAEDAFLSAIDPEGAAMIERGESDDTAE